MKPIFHVVKVELDGIEHNITLLLDMRHIKELQSKTGKKISDIIAEAPQDWELLSALLDASLRHKNNCNPQHMNGDDLFDALVRSGVTGADNWTELVNDIAVVSGYMSRAAADASVAYLRRVMQRGIDSLIAGVETEPEENASNPTQTATE